MKSSGSVRTAALGALMMTCLLAAGGVAQERRDAIAFVPFTDASDFEGDWTLETEVPRFLAAYLKAEHDVPLLSPALVMTYRKDAAPALQADDVKFWSQLESSFGVRYVVAGTVIRFDVSRFTTGSPALGAYESYKGEIGVAYQVYDLREIARAGVVRPSLRGEASGEFADRSLALTLWGKPTPRNVEFNSLTRIAFGSEDFRQTVIGQACVDAAKMFVGDLEIQRPGMLAPRGRGDTPADLTSLRLRRSERAGAVVFVEGRDLFISLGSEDGVRKGMDIAIIAPAPATDTVGTMTVREVRGPHLSLGNVQSPGDSVTTAHRVVFRAVE